MRGFELSDGYIERKTGGCYEGEVLIEGINLSPIQATYFEKDNETYLWLKRKNVLEYDFKAQKYNERERSPKWECYLKKQMNADAVAYKGEFFFMRFRFSITGVWDGVLGKDKKQRLNLFIERLPLNQQTIINNINERKRKEQ